MLYTKTVIIHWEDLMKHITTLCEQIAEFMNVKAGGTCSNNCTLTLRIFECMWENIPRKYMISAFCHDVN